jgi:hypothetical protein
MAIVKTIWEGLGKTPQARVRNLVMMILAITFMIAVTQNLRLGYNNPADVNRACKCKGFWVEWGPAAIVTVDWKKTSSTGGAQ